MQIDVKATYPKEWITVKVKLSADGKSAEAIIRKTVMGDDDLVAGVYGLNRLGHWVPKEETSSYPTECRLPVELYGANGFPVGYCECTIVNELMVSSDAD